MQEAGEPCGVRVGQIEMSAQKLSKGSKSKLLKHQMRERQWKIYRCGFYWVNIYPECHWGS